MTPSPPPLPRDRARSTSPLPSDISDREKRMRHLEADVSKISNTLSNARWVVGLLASAIIGLGSVTVYRSIVTESRVDALEHRVSESSLVRRELARDVQKITVQIGEVARDVAALRREQERSSADSSERFDRLEDRLEDRRR